jgi:iron complex outermembrane receptor protein
MQPSYTIVDLSLAYRSANEQWVAELFVDNATDEEVKTEAFYGGNQTFYKWGDPRQAGIRVSFKYK